MLSSKHLKDICLLTLGSDQCRYLAEDETDSRKFYCLKKSSKAKEIDIEVEDFLQQMKRKGKDPKKENTPIGDNCSGYIFLRHKEQGYDKNL
jgi:hypothetical protein